MRIAVIEVDAVIGTDPYIAVTVFINLANTVMRHREGRAVLLVPCHILITFSIAGETNQTIGTAHPPFAVTGLEHGMQTVALTRHRYLIERHIAVIGVGSETGETIVGTHPYILPFIYKASPDDVVRNRSIIAGIVDIMGDGIGECHLIESVIGSDIEIAGFIGRETLDGIAVESRNLGEVPELQIGTIESTLGTNPVASALGIIGKRIDQRLFSGTERNQSAAEMQTGKRTYEQTFRSREQGIDIAPEVSLTALHIEHTEFLQLLALCLIGKSLHGRCFSILIIFSIKLQDTVAGSQIEHPALEAERIDTCIAESMFLEMAITLITIIAVKTIVGSEPYHSLMVLGYDTNCLSTFKGGVNETLRMDGERNKEHSNCHADAVYRFCRLFHACKFTQYS